MALVRATSAVIAALLLIVACSADSGVDYELVSDTNRTARHPAKRSIVVRIAEPLSEADLSRVAIELKRREFRDFERTFIEYYLPDMKVGAGAWATTHFNPELEVRVYADMWADIQTVSEPD